MPVNRAHLKLDFAVPCHRAHITHCVSLVDSCDSLVDLFIHLGVEPDKNTFDLIFDSKECHPGCQLCSDQRPHTDTERNSSHVRNFAEGLLMDNIVSARKGAPSFSILLYGDVPRGMGLVRPETGQSALDYLNSDDGLNSTLFEGFPRFQLESPGNNWLILSPGLPHFGMRRMNNVQPSMVLFFTLIPKTRSPSGCDARRGGVTSFLRLCDQVPAVARVLTSELMSEIVSGRVRLSLAPQARLRQFDELYLNPTVALLDAMLARGVRLCGASLADSRIHIDSNFFWLLSHPGIAIHVTRVWNGLLATLVPMADEWFATLSVVDALTRHELSSATPAIAHRIRAGIILGPEAYPMCMSQNRTLGRLGGQENTLCGESVEVQLVFAFRDVVKEFMLVGHSAIVVGTKIVGSSNRFFCQNDALQFREIVQTLCNVFRMSKEEEIRVLNGAHELFGLFTNISHSMMAGRVATLAKALKVNIPSWLLLAWLGNGPGAHSQCMHVDANPFQRFECFISALEAIKAERIDPNQLSPLMGMQMMSSSNGFHIDFIHSSTVLDDHILHLDSMAKADPVNIDLEQIYDRLDLEKRRSVWTVLAQQLPSCSGESIPGAPDVSDLDASVIDVVVKPRETAFWGQLRGHRGHNSPEESCESSVPALSASLRDFAYLDWLEYAAQIIIHTRVINAFGDALSLCLPPESYKRCFGYDIAIEQAHKILEQIASNSDPQPGRPKGTKRPVS